MLRLYVSDKDHKVLKSFASFMAYTGGLQEQGDYICPCCHGTKRVIAPDAINDPVEGYKMAERVMCPICLGTGIVEQTAWKNIYRERKKEFKEKKARIKERKRLIKNIQAKLTKEEIKFIDL